MSKTNPVGIRFDEDKLAFVVNREGLASKQKVVDFLLDKYWWENRIPAPVVEMAPVVETETVQESPKTETPAESVPEQTIEEPPVTEVSEPPKTESKWIRNEPKKKKEIPPPTQQMPEALVFAQEIHEAKTIEQLDVIEKEVNNAIAKNRFSPIEKEVVKRVLREKRDRIGK